MNHHFLDELKEGSIQFHDDLQFELKLEFNYNPEVKNNIFTQEFYLFIPESLIINSDNYSKSDFYHDETNFIRYKTPNYTFDEISDLSSKKNPLEMIYYMQVTNDEDLKKMIDEIKLFGNIFRSTLRNETHVLIKLLNQLDQNSEVLQLAINRFAENVNKTHTLFLKTCNELEQKYHNQTLDENIKFVDEFITNTIEYYLIWFLEKLRTFKIESLKICDKKICEILVNEGDHRKTLLPQVVNLTELQFQEMIAYRQSLLQKFMLEALQLKSNRIAASEQHGPLFQSIAAGAAMLIYMVLFALTWKTSFVINSIPFVLTAVLFYILKDQIKEGIKTYYKQKAIEWFSDYKTKIYTTEDFPLGQLKENFSFVDPNKLPDEIDKIRNSGFHNHLETLHRHETIILYKREIDLYEGASDYPLNELNIIFRYNIHRYLEKASNPIQYRAVLDEKSEDIRIEPLPKVYHLNIVMKETHTASDQEKATKINKFRVILDKRGISQVENL